MYNVEVLTNDDYMFSKEPTVYPNIRTVSITTGRILITDSNDHMYNFNPMHIKDLNINWMQGGVVDGK